MFCWLKSQLVQGRCREGRTIHCLAGPRLTSARVVNLIVPAVYPSPWYFSSWQWKPERHQVESAIKALVGRHFLFPETKEWPSLGLAAGYSLAPYFARRCRVRSEHEQTTMLRSSTTPPKTWRTLKCSPWALYTALEMPGFNVALNTPPEASVTGKGISGFPNALDANHYENGCMR